MSQLEDNTLKTILIVEANPVVREAVREILERAGFCVFAADQGAQFLNRTWHRIEKPFLPSQLVARVNELLHTPEPSQRDDHFATLSGPKASAAGA